MSRAAPWWSAAESLPTVCDNRFEESVKTCRVPPLVPDFRRLEDRIFDWDFANWREDGPPVYEPRNLTAERSWELFLEKVDVAHRIVREGIDLARSGMERTYEPSA